MKVGDIIVCVNAQDCDLTVGKRYSVESLGQEHGDGFVRVVKDRGGLGGFMAFRFKVDESATVNKILERYGE